MSTILSNMRSFYVYLLMLPVGPDSRYSKPTPRLDAVNSEDWPTCMYIVLPSSIHFMCIPV